MSTWWDEARIQATVTRQFACSHLLPEEIERLDRPLGFGDGLTDGTYWEWIDEKAKKFFLVLVDLGLADQIFGLIDDSWDDDDLPIALDHVERLELTAARDERCERKFYHRQFHYLLKPLRKREHTIYQDTEVVPLDVVDRRASVGGVSVSVGVGGVAGSSSSSHSVDKVTLPDQPGRVFCRRRIPIRSGPGCLSHEDFQYEVSRIRNVQNDHLVSYFCSYVHQGCGYVLFSPASDANLKTLLASTPAPIKNLDKDVRRRLLMDWCHCLVDTLCHLHSRGLSHGNIRPSQILVNNQNHIFFSDFTRLNSELLLAEVTDTRSSFDKEAYDYAAPEQWYRPSTASLGSGLRKGTLTSPLLPGSSGGFAGPSALENHAHVFSISRGGTDHHPAGPTTMMHAPNPHLNPQAADVFSLGCIIVELLSFVMKRQTRAFATHRSARHKTPGRGGAVLDSSFHRNLVQVESWMTGLAKDAKKKTKDTAPVAAVFRGVTPMLHVVERMLALNPSERPSIQEVQTRMYQILTESCGISEPHCVHAPQFNGGWANYSLGGVKTARTMPLSPTDTLMRTLSGGATAEDEDDADETMSIATSKRSSGQFVPRPHVLHRHHPSLSGGSGVWGGSVLQRQETHESEHGYDLNRERGRELDRQDDWGRDRRDYDAESPIRRDSTVTAEAPARTVTDTDNTSSNPTPRKPRAPSFELSSGLLAIQNLQIRGKPRPPWQAAPSSPVLTGSGGQPLSV